MNRMKRRVLAVFIAMIFTFSVLVTVKVFAEDYGTGTTSLSLDFGNNAQGYTVDGVTVNGDNWSGQGDRFFTTDGKYTIVVSITAPEGKQPRIIWGGNWNNVISSQRVSEGNNKWKITLTTTEVASANPDNPTSPFMGLSVGEDSGVEPGPEPGEGFDGKAYVIWSCESGGICFKHFDNIPDFNDGNSTFYKDTDIKDARTGETFNIKAQYKGWSTDDKFDKWVTAYKKFNKTETIDWSKVNPADMLGDPVDMRQYEEGAIKAGKCTRDNTPQDVFEACVDDYAISQGVFVSRAQLQPVGEPTYPNAYVSYGDRNFKVVIYNSNYKGIAMGSLDSLSYYPSEWTNAFIRRDQFDISGTTKDKPSKLDSILLENTVNIKVLNYNNYEITSIEALDVPKEAVSISKQNGEWKLVFSSNFYDNVVFKATDSKGEVSYFLIKRYTIDAWIKHDNDTPILNADFYFDRKKSYSDFVIKATLVFKDGTEKKVELKPSFGIDDGLGNITDAYEVDEEKPKDGPAGKGLKKSTFQVVLSKDDEKNIKKIYLTAEYKGSTSTNYAGSFAGSGKGVLANIYVEGEE